MDLRDWVNEGLMTFFFLVVGLEAKRELAIGQLRERRRLAALAVISVVAHGERRRPADVGLTALTINPSGRVQHVAQPLGRSRRSRASSRNWATDS